jgi:hypothetical protein
LPPLHRHIQRASTPGTGPSRDPTPVAPKSRGPTAPPVQPRSVLVVSHDLDGFLRAKDRGLVASRYRSWGSPRFAETRSHGPWSNHRSGRSRAGVSRASLPATPSLPFEEFPPSAAVPCHHGLCLRAVGSHPFEWNRRLRGVALRAGSVCVRHPCGHRIVRSFHGLVSPSRSDVLRNLPGLPWGDPQTRRPASGRP